MRFPLPRLIALTVALIACLNRPALGQFDSLPYRGGSAQVNLKVGGYLTINGGWGLSLSVGTWTSFRYLQPALSLSLNFVGGPNNLGNRNRYLTRNQLNILMTPMLTAGTGRGLYQEINPFYFGNMGSVFANYQYSLTLGSNFIVMPRGVRRNVTTFRNRTQQLVYIGLRGGSPQWDLNLNLYEDFFGTDNATLQGIADNFDRFYTGGGNLQFRTKYGSAKFYADIYTGNFVRDLFDAPDLYLPYSNDTTLTADRYIGTGAKERHPRYVSQEPGQKLFNTARNFAVIELTPAAFNQGSCCLINHSIMAFAGLQGGHKQMRAQNIIHNTIIIDKINPRYNTDSVYTSSAYKERLHHFYPAYDRGRWFGGIGYIANTIPISRRP